MFAKGLLSISLAALLFCILVLPLVSIIFVEMIALGVCVVFLSKYDILELSNFWKPLTVYERIYVALTLPCVASSCWKWLQHLYPGLEEKLPGSVVAVLACFLPESVLFAVPPAVIVLLTVPATYVGLCWLTRQFSVFFRVWKLSEYFFSTVVFAVWGILMLYVSLQTGTLIYPIALLESSEPVSGEYVIPSIFFGADNLDYMLQTSYLCSDSFRHPNYSVAMWPFLAPALVGGVLIYGIGGATLPLAYSIGLALCLTQIMMGAVIAVLLKRLCEPFTDRWFALAIAVLYSCSFPFLFALTPERLTFSALMLVAFVYLVCRTRQDDCFRDTWDIRHYLLALAAIGTTLLSAIMVLWVMVQEKIYLRRFLYLGLCAVFFLIVFMPFHLEYLQYSFQFTPRETSSSTIRMNMMKLLHMYESCIFMPSYYLSKGGVFQTRIMDLPKVYLLVGTGVISLCCLSCYFYRREYFVRMAFVWILVSVGILGVVGFGASPEEMILFSSYFSWAVLPLTVLPLYRIVGNKFLQATVVLFLMAGISMFLNVKMLTELTDHAKDVYVVPRNTPAEIPETAAIFPSMPVFYGQNEVFYVCDAKNITITSGDD